MNHSLLLLIPILGLIACSGSSEETTTTDNDTTTVDTAVVELLPTYADWEAYAAALEPEIESLDSIFVRFERDQENFTPEQKDSAYFMYVDMMNKVAGQFGDIESASYEEDQKYQQKYGPYGLNLGGAEGYLWLMVDTSVPGKRFKKYIHPDLYEAAMLGEILGQQHSGDAAMIHSYMEWGSIVTDLEERLIKNKDSQYRREFMDAYKSFLMTYMFGMDNTPILSWSEEGGLNEEVKKAYEAMIADKKHKTGQIIQKHLEKLEAQNFQVSWENQWNPSDKEIENYLGLNISGEVGVE